MFDLEVFRVLERIKDYCRITKDPPVPAGLVPFSSLGEDERVDEEFMVVYDDGVLHETFSDEDFHEYKVYPLASIYDTKIRHAVISHAEGDQYVAEACVCEKTPERSYIRMKIFDAQKRYSDVIIIEHGDWILIP